MVLKVNDYNLLLQYNKPSFTAIFWNFTQTDFYWISPRKKGIESHNKINEH